MSEIKYLIGDATEPVGSGPRMILHVCNDIGGWGRGFVLALSNKWEGPEREYRIWATGQNPEYPKFQLGEIQAVEVKQDLFVVNMIGQHGVTWVGDIPPVRYDRIRQCLNKVVKMAKYISEDTVIHMPRIGSGLAGGTWQVIEGLIKETLIGAGIDVFVYDLPE